MAVDATERAAKREERETQRMAKADEAARRRKQKALARQLRTGGIAAAVVALLVAAYLFMPQSASYTAGSEGRFVDGVLTFSNGTGHVTGPVAYAQTPPAGGEHNATWLNCGIYTEAVPNEFAVHALEHGAVWVTYDPGLSEPDVEMLRSLLPSTYIVMSPYVGLPTPVVLSAWNAQLRVDSATDPRIPLFLEEYWRSQRVPEPGALCSGGYSAPGRS
ncbi:MAG: DUF3105 domain-containing protein [Acidobacteria bacterium]|nr:DUF3105 domain-containing protein [Acidobacteriota bacterium]